MSKHNRAEVLLYVQDQIRKINSSLKAAAMPSKVTEDVFELTDYDSDLESFANGATLKAVVATYRANVARNLNPTLRNMTAADNGEPTDICQKANELYNDLCNKLKTKYGGDIIMCYSWDFDSSAIIVIRDDECSINDPDSN